MSDDPYQKGYLLGLRRAADNLRFYPNKGCTCAQHIRDMADSFERWIDTADDYKRRKTTITRMEEPRTKCVQCGQMFNGESRYGLCSATCELAADRLEDDYRRADDMREYATWLTENEQ